MNNAEKKEAMKKANKKAFADSRDSAVTVVSLIVIILQSLVIILGFVYRWDWLAYECAAMLIIPAIIVLYHGVVAIINADKLMSEEIAALEAAKREE